MYSTDLLKKVTTFGSLSYPLRKILNLIEVEDEATFSKDFYIQDSPVQRAYQKGIDQADYIMDSKLFEMAKAGDKKAMEMYIQRKRQQEEAHETNRLTKQVII